MDLGTLSGQLTLGISQFTASINQAARQAAGLGQTLNNAVGAPAAASIQATTRAVEGAGASFKDLGRIVSGILISQLFYGAISSIKEATASIIDFTANMETAQISMEYFLGSQERAHGFLEVMKDFAATTPFSTEQALDSSRRLMAMGFAADSLKSVMTIMTDAASATGATAQQMDRVVLALGQMKTNGFIAGQELRQLAEAGIPAYKILQQQLGLTATQIKNIGKLKIAGDIGVAAILQGLQMRYKGAADRIAQTFHGMWSTIRDDALIGGEIVFKGFFSKFEGFTRRLRNFMEKTREILTEKGLGGLFAELIPKELQGSIKSIISGMKQLSRAIGVLVDAFKPLIGNVLGSLIKLFGLVLPIIGLVAQVITTLVQVALNASPAVKLFAEAIILLLIANTAAKALMFLWTVTRMGVICSAVAQAVMVLAKAIKLLYLVCTRNPLVGIIMLVAAALMYLALSSKTVAGWLDTVGSKLSSLGGVDLDKMFLPENNKSVDEWMEQFNKQLAGIQDNLKGTGKDAEKAGKKIKDTFVSSFDELYQIPDKLDDVGSGLEDLGNMDMPDMNLDMPKLTLPDIGTDTSGMPDVPWLPPANGKPPGPKDPGDSFKIPPPDGSPVTDVIDTINERLERLKLSVTGTFAKLTIDIAQWALDNTLALSGWALKGAEAFNQWSIDTIKTFNDWVISTPFIQWVDDTSVSMATWAADTSLTIGTWVTDTTLSFGTWVVDTTLSLGNWVLDTGKGIAGWAIAAGKDIGSWATDATKSVVTWADTTGKNVGTWALDTGKSIGTWAFNAGKDIGTWAGNAVTDMAGWGTDTGKTVVTWANDTGKGIGVWATNTAKNIGTWSVDTGKDIGTWSKETGKTFGTWVSTTASGVYDWATNTAGNLVTWANGTIGTVSSWAGATQTSIGTWITGTSAAVASWVDNVAGNFVSFANSAYTAISGWAGASWGAFSSFLSGTAGSVGSWASSLIGTIVGWAKSAWSAIKSLASAVGKEIGDWSSSAAEAVGDTYQGMAGWASDNKSWLVPVGVGVVVAGLAAATILSGGLAAPAFAGLAGATLALETGGIVDRDQMVRIGEGNKREAVIPLQNDSYMKPFSAAVAADLRDMMGDFSAGGGNKDTRPILYVGNLIADDRGLKELYRKMEVIAISEQQRKGG